MFHHRHLRLGVNIDHVATIRNARGGAHPDPLRAAEVAVAAGADGITAHLREDRRHITDTDIARLSQEIAVPLNLEMAATDEMLAIAVRHRPNAVCLVPERRAEVTTEGGLDVVGGVDHLRPMIQRLRDCGIRVSLFIDPDAAQVDAARWVGADIIELHTGAYCAAEGGGQAAALHRIEAASDRGHGHGLEIHAGHGLNFASVAPIARLAAVAELNIGHFLIGEAIFSGLGPAISAMRAAMDAARAPS